MQQRLAPLFAEDSEGKDRRWTFAGVIVRLENILLQTLAFNQTEVELTSTPDDEQQRLLDQLAERL